MRIAIQATQLVPGGGLTHFNRVTEWFENLAPDWEFIVLGRDGQQSLFEPRPRNFDFRYHALPARSLAHRVFWETAVLPQVVDKLRPDLFFVPGNQGAARVSCPKVSLIHNIAPFSTEYLGGESTYQRLRQTLLRWSTISTLRSSQGVVFLSEYCRRILSRYVDSSATKTAVVYHGKPEITGDTDDRAVLRELGIAGPFLLCAAHVFRYKKIDEMVRAYLVTSGQNGAMPRLYIAGTCYDGPYVESIKRRLRESTYRDSVVFLGNVDGNKLQVLYRNCDAFLFPSVLETCSVILIEAMTHGCAIACSDRSCLPEVTGRRMLYLNPDDIEDFARKIRLIVEDGELNSRLRQNSLERAEDFSWRISAQQLLDFFADVVGFEAPRTDELHTVHSIEAG